MPGSRFEHRHYVVDLDIAFVFGALVGREYAFVTLVREFFYSCNNWDQLAG